VPGFESVLLSGAFAPAGTPAPVLNRLNQEIVRAINLPEIKEKFAALGVETVGSSPQEATAAIKSEITKVSRADQGSGYPHAIASSTKLQIPNYKQTQSSKLQATCHVWSLVLETWCLF
jgi:hypothetical protein